jgi:Tol biopolymer transport system component
MERAVKTSLISVLVLGSIVGIPFSHSMAEDNLIFFAITEYSGDAQLYSISTDGSGKTQLTDEPGKLYGPALSPDGDSIAFYNHLSNQTWSLYLMGVDGSGIRRLTNQLNALDWSPDWSPDGSQIVFARSYSTPTWRSEIWVINPDGSGLHRLGTVDGQGPDWSPDGSKIVYFNYVDGGGDIWSMNADGSDPVQLTDSPAEDWWPKYSPDGSKIAFQSKRDGNHEIYAMDNDGSWSPDGDRIAFITTRDGHYEIYIMNVDGSDQTRITNTTGHAIDPEWAPENSVPVAPQSWGNMKGIYR